jgi:hypothetical protein
MSEVPTMMEKACSMRRAPHLISILLVLAALLQPNLIHAQPTHPPSSASAAAPKPVSLPANLVRFALGLKGTPYVSGGDGFQGVDCSGLISLVYLKTAGLDLPKSVSTLYQMGSPARSPLHLGDLLFFDTAGDGPPSRPTHVGIYVGSGRVVHAASEGFRTGVIISALADVYYSQRFLGARRVLPWPGPLLDMVITDEHAPVVAEASYPSREELQIAVYNRMTGGGPMDLTLLKNGRQILARRITPSSGKPALVSMVPDVGVWTVSVSRIMKGRLLGSLTFLVEE